MRRTSVFMTIAFLAGLGIGFFARSAGRGTLQRRDTHAADLAAIEKLHRADIEATLTQADYPDFQVLKYAPDIKDVQIADGWAIEVVNTEATYKTSAKDNPVSVQNKGMRVLKRQSDGSWKFALVGLK